MKFGIETDKEVGFQWPWVYYHGDLHKAFDDMQDPWEVPGDLVYCDTSINEVPDGTHQVEVLGKPATLYLKSHTGYGIKNGVLGEHLISKGAIVWNEDKEVAHKVARDITAEGF